jgi:hypothetical protein
MPPLPLGAWGGLAGAILAGVLLVSLVSWRGRYPARVESELEEAVHRKAATMHDRTLLGTLVQVSSALALCEVIGGDGESVAWDLERTRGRTVARILARAPKLRPNGALSPALAW